MTTLVINSVEGMLKTMFTGWALATGKIKEQYINARTRQALTYLSDRDLRDIGLSRERVQRGEF